ncbi:MAG TPA: GNAT family N-acetyltransferase [Candidatus Omnitrophota bacterium]|nr:GNAT family N-acetyltransferase [Candidatus Omnitrophota bacterium]
MPINIYPAQLFTATRPSGPKVPLAERAAAAALERSIPLDLARAHYHLERFMLGGNRIHLFCPEEQRRAAFMPFVVSHLGSAFSDRSVAFYASKDMETTSFVSVKASPIKANFSPSLFDPLGGREEKFTLDFDIGSERITLIYICSRILGQGGAALLALYNIARDMEIGKIVFDVRKGNHNAKLFYRKLGFGEPTGRTPTEWELNIPSGRGR